jgi:hypothetical protein
MPDNATIYISDPSLLGSRLFDSIDIIQSYDGLLEDDTATGVFFDIGVAQVQMNFMPKEELPQHLNGFLGYAEQMFSGNQDDLLYLLSRIRHVTFAMGCVITPSFDQDGQAEGFLLEMTNRLNGLLFIYDSIVDYDGNPLTGPLAKQGSLAS